MRSSCGFGILLKSLKRPMIVLRLAISMPRVCVLSRKTSSNSAGERLRGANQIFNGELQREEWILEFVGESAGEFAPCGDALALDELFALRGELFGHVVKAAREHAHFVVAVLREHVCPSCRQPLLQPRAQALR